MVHRSIECVPQLGSVVGLCQCIHVCGASKGEVLIQERRQKNERIEPHFLFVPMDTHTYSVPQGRRKREELRSVKAPIYINCLVSGRLGHTVDICIDSYVHCKDNVESDSTPPDCLCNT